MPQFDLRNIKCAKYNNTAGAISYSDVQAVGDAMTANLELRFAEGRLFAESSLAEYIRKCTGGTISLGVKYIKTGAQKLLFGLTENSRQVDYVDEGGTSVTANITSLRTGKKTVGSYVGLVFYSPDMIDGEEKFTCVFLSRCMFGEPSMTLQTASESIQFNTPATSGEFLADESDAGSIKEIAICDDEGAAKAWCDAVFADAA